VAAFLGLWFMPRGAFEPLRRTMTYVKGLMR
jgi:hypothetical protein